MLIFFFNRKILHVSVNVSAILPFTYTGLNDIDGYGSFAMANHVVYTL